MKKIFWLYIIFIHIILTIGFINPELIYRINYKLGLMTKPVYYDRILARHLLQHSKIKPGAVVFLGDSIIEKANVNYIVPNNVNFGIAKDSTHGLLQRLPLYRSINNASLIVLHIGVNDLSLRRDTVEISFARYKQLIAQLPQIPLVISAVLPLGERKHNVNQENDRIIAFNQLLQELAASQENYYFFDISDKFKDENGNLSSVYHVDHIHLNSTGYQIFVQEMKQFLLENKLL